jgi:predicted nuclease of predicted toxin-antitoxin system
MQISIKFYTDEHVHPAVIAGLRRRGIDVLSSQDANMLAVSDEEHLKLALQENRVIFTQDDDFLKFHAQQIPHKGIVYAHQRTTIGQIIQGLMLISQVLNASERLCCNEFLFFSPRILRGYQATR